MSNAAENCLSDLHWGGGGGVGPEHKLAMQITSV